MPPILTFKVMYFSSTSCFVCVTKGRCTLDSNQEELYFDAIHNYCACFNVPIITQAIVFKLITHILQ